MTQQQFKQLFDLLQAGTATQEQMNKLLDALHGQQELAAYFQELLKVHFDDKQTLKNSASGSAKMDSKLFNDLLRPTQLQKQQQQQANLDNSWKIIEQQIASSETSPLGNTHAFKAYSKRKWMVAASILLIVGFGAALYVYLQSRPASDHVQTAVNLNLTQQSNAGNSPITPGKVAAVLTLENGQQLSLDSNEDQNIKNGQQLIAYNKAGKVDYQTGTAQNRIAHFNTLTTQKGNRYQLILPDGTKAWLNAESTIRFPDKFAEDHRTVSITGEVYFEVIHDETRPFSVQVKGQIIRDFGTAFNVNAYDDEKDIKTTLLEGIIEVNNTRLKPGWQASIQPGGKMSIDKNADLNEVISWKNNMFLFHQTDMRSILRQVARWYNVEIIYHGSFDQTFTGGISRQASLDEILKILSFSNKIKFDIHDRKIIVHPN